jgi:hypothetical protein
MLYGWVVYLHRCHLRHLPRRSAPRSIRTPKVSPLENSTYHAGRQAVRKTESSQYRTPQIERHIMQGSTARVEKLQDRPQGDGVVNTVYIERLNVTFRARPSSLARRGRGLNQSACDSYTHAATLTRSAAAIRSTAAVTSGASYSWDSL